jgi:hypothetical protein
MMVEARIERSRRTCECSRSRSDPSARDDGSPDRRRVLDARDLREVRVGDVVAMTPTTGLVLFCRPRARALGT